MECQNKPSEITLFTFTFFHTVLLLVKFIWDLRKYPVPLRKRGHLLKHLKCPDPIVQGRTASEFCNSFNPLWTLSVGSKMSFEKFQAYVCLSLFALLPIVTGQWIDQPPKYDCPRDPRVLYPCNCTQGSDDGVYIECSNTNIASLAVGLGQVKTKIHTLVISKCNMEKLFGDIFQKPFTIKILRIEDTPIKVNICWEFSFPPKMSDLDCLNMRILFFCVPLPQNSNLIQVSVPFRHFSLSQLFS